MTETENQGGNRPTQVYLTNGHLKVMCAYIVSSTAVEIHYSTDDLALSKLIEIIGFSGRYCFPK